MRHNYSTSQYLLGNHLQGESSPFQFMEVICKRSELKILRKGEENVVEFPTKE